MKRIFCLTVMMATMASVADVVTNVVVAPLTYSHWTQGAPYNDYSPKGTTAFTSGWEAGCVAIAAAQELYYWQWPWRLDAIHETSHPVLNESNLALRFDGNVPFDWANMPDSFSSDGTLAQKHAVAHLVLACQSLVQMQFVSAGGLASKNLPGTMEWFEFDRQVDPKSGAQAIADLQSDFEFGSPVQTGINFKGYGGHEVVGLGFATTSGDETKNLIWLNLGWGGGSDGWYNLGETDASETIIKSVQLGFRPIKSVQIEPIAPVSGSSVTLNWHLPNCYANKISGFSVAKKMPSASTTAWTDDFSTGGKGRSSNTNEMRVANGGLMAWDGTASAIYTWDEALLLSSDSILTYDIGSSYMSGMEARFEARFGNGGWQKIGDISLNSGRTSYYDNNGAESTMTSGVAINLGQYAGKIAQFRVAVEYTTGGTFANYWASMKIDNLSISNVKTFETVSTDSTVAASARSATFSGLTTGETYAFTVTPVMSDNSAAVTQTATTTIGTPAAAPTINSVTMSPKGSNLVQDGFYADIAMGWNIIDVACSESVTTLEAFISHQSVLPQSKIEVVDNGSGSFSINIDATEVAAKWANQKMILTLKATNATGESAYKDVELCLKASGVPENVPGGKVWTGDSALFGANNYTAKWANNVLPSNGDKATFYVADGDFGAEMNLNLSSATELGYVNATGLGQLTISGNSSETLTIDTLKNDVQVEVNSTKLKIKKAVPSDNIVIDSGSSLDCEIDQSRSGFIKKVSGGYVSALTDSSLWKGTVVFEGYSADTLNLNNYGNDNSRVLLNGVSGWLSYNTTVNPTVELVDSGTTPALHWNNGSGSSVSTFKSLVGTGTFKTSTPSKGGNERLKITSLEGFGGSFDLASKTVVIGSYVGTYTNNGRMNVNSGNDVTIASGKTWTIGGGMYLGGDQTITVNGTLNGAITAEGTGTTLALKPTSAVTAASLNMANNTISIEKSASAASAVTVSGEANLAGSTIAVTLSDEATDSIALMSAGSFTDVDTATLTGIDDYELAVEDGVLYAKALNPGYSGPKPAATWVSWEFEDNASDHDGYSITLNDNTINSDGNIVIGSGAIKGVTIELPSGTYTNVSLLVKCKTPQGGAPMANAAIAGVLDSDNNPMAPICTTAGDNSFIGGYLNKNNGAIVTSGYYSYGFSTPPPTLPENKEAYMLFAFEATTGKGTALYLGEDIASLAGGNAGYLNWPNRKINIMAIGGSTQSNSNFGAWTDLEIEAVALFVDKWLTPGDIAGYEFPEPEEPVRTDVHFKSGFWGTGGENPFVVVLDNDKPTTVLEGETVIIDDKSSDVGTIYFGSTLPENANKIRVSRNVIFSSGANNPSMLDGATITVDEGVTLTFKRQWNNMVLGDVVINGHGTVKFDQNDGTITIGGALSGTAAVTVETGKQISVASDGAIANMIAGDGTVAYAAMLSLPMPLAASWTGTVELPEYSANAEKFDNYGNANSTVKINGYSGWLNWTELGNPNKSKHTTKLNLIGALNVTDASGYDYIFDQITGTGSISFPEDDTPNSVTITDLEVPENTTGITVNNNMPSKQIRVANLILPSNASVAPGTRVLAVGGNGTVAIGTVKIGSAVQNVQLERRNKGEDGDGLYVKVQIDDQGAGTDQVITVITEPEQESVEVPVDGNFTGTIVVAPTVKSIDTGNVAVAADKVKVKYGDNDITGAFSISGSLEIALNADGSVEDVSVRPTIDVEADAAVDMSVESPTIKVRAISGLWYAVKSGTALGNGGVAGDTAISAPELCTASGTKTLTAPPKNGADARFYTIMVAATESDLTE